MDLVDFGWPGDADRDVPGDRNSRAVSLLKRYQDEAADLRNKLHEVRRKLAFYEWRYGKLEREMPPTVEEICDKLRA